MGCRDIFGPVRSLETYLGVSEGFRDIYGQGRGSEISLCQ